MKAQVAVTCALFLCNFLRADDLVVRNGTVYHNYKIIGHDAGYVTILHSTGGGQIPLSELPDSLQKQLGYDPVKAAAAVRADDLALLANRVAIEHEQEKQEIRHRKELVAEAKRLAAARKAKAEAEAEAAAEAAQTTP